MESFREHVELRLFPISCVVPFFVLNLCAVRSRYEDDGTGLPRPPGSCLRPRSLRSGQVGLRFDVSFVGHGLLVDSGRRRISTTLSPPRKISLSSFRVRVWLSRVGTLRPVLSGPAGGHRLAWKVS